MNVDGGKDHGDDEPPIRTGVPGEPAFRNGGADLDALGALAEPNRRALYEYVCTRGDWVGREEAAEAVGIRRGVAAHHLERLAEGGLLEIDYQRLTGKSGPGAGRPAKVYRRASTELEVSLPPRRYDLAASLLARAVDRASRDGVPVEDAVAEAAREEGARIADAIRPLLDGCASADTRRARLIETLEAYGFEPVAGATGAVTLRNCPFHRLAQAHTELICGMNLQMLTALLDALDGPGFAARLEPGQDCCCVCLYPRG